jgi:hypothetical protein
MAFYPITGGIGVQAIASKSTTQNHPLGEIIQAVDPTYGTAEFIYLKGVASTVVGSWVGYNGATFASTLAVANGKYPLAIAMSTNNTTTSYAWYQISGVAQGKNVTSITNTSGISSIWLTSTAGSVMSTSVIGDRIFNAQLVSRTVGLTSTFQLARPFVENAVSLSN